MAVKLLRCSGQWVKIKGHPCWRIESALVDMGIEYERVSLPWPHWKRQAIKEATGGIFYPAIEFDDGTVYREQSADMERTIREGRLMEKAGSATAATSG
jgi:hypothetical protein